MSSGPNPIRVSLRRLEHGAGLSLPSYESASAAGMDLAAAVPEGAPETLAPGDFRWPHLASYAIAPQNVDGVIASLRRAVVLRGDFGGSNWRAEHTLFLEAGQLQHLAKQAGQFFG